VFESIYILLLLLPVAILSGYLLGERKSKSIKKTNTVFPGDYIKGLNFLFNEQPDKAVEVFIDLLEVNEETVETHLALGHLFRRRGEVERAIRIHQNLIERSTIEPEQRAQALYQLGQDYLSAGLLDRAEDLFNKLIEQEPQTEAAMQRLIEIYQQEKDWRKAIDITKRLALHSKIDYSSFIAHYYCEQAEQMIRYNEPAKALKLSSKATRIDPLCARASIIAGQIALKKQRYDDALDAYQNVEKQNPELLSEIIDDIIFCYRKLNLKSELHEYINKLQSHYGGLSLILAWVDVLQYENNDDAEQFLVNYLKQSTSIRALDKLIEIKKIESTGKAQENFRILKDVTTQLLEHKQNYQCQSCGFLANIFHWQCPGCKAWATIKSDIEIEIES